MKTQISQLEAELTTLKVINLSLRPNYNKQNKIVADRKVALLNKRQKKCKISFYKIIN
jgi:hypothetical protein